MPLDFAVYGDKLSYADYIDGDDLHPLVLAAWLSPKEETPHEKQRPDPDTSNTHSHISPSLPISTDPKTETPDLIRQLNEIGNLIDDLRLTWHESFASHYTAQFAEPNTLNPPWSQWAEIIHTCKMHLSIRLWRESEQTALLVKIDFLSLTRCALYIPAAFYPDDDRTFVTCVLPGTGWTVRRYGAGEMMVGRGEVDERCVGLAGDFGPFVKRVFTRERSMDDGVGGVDGVGVGTKRLLFDLDGEYKSMQRLLTEPIGENYRRVGEWGEREPGVRPGGRE